MYVSTDSLANQSCMSDHNWSIYDLKLAPKSFITYEKLRECRMYVQWQVKYLLIMVLNQFGVI